MIYTADGRGYVLLIDHMGDDLTPANAAKASFGRRSEALGERERRLLAFLTESDPPHTMPFRHPMLTLEVKAPLFVARQWFRHVVGGRFVDTPWSEASGRYIAYDGYWAPPYLRLAPENKKQGSIDEPHPRSAVWLERFRAHCDDGAALYDDMVTDGVAPEQARTLLGLNVYTSWWWTASLQAAAHFVNLRNDPHAQLEIQEYARIVDDICARLWPTVWQHRSQL